LLIILLVAAGIILAIIIFFFNLGNTQEKPHLQVPADKQLKIELVAEGLSFPTSMEFIDNSNSILVLEKDKGTVRLVSSLNGTVQEEPVLKVQVDNEAERGLLGIAITGNVDRTRNASYIIITPANNERKTVTVFLYFTEKYKQEKNDGEKQLLRNRVYSYEWNGKKLVNPILILDLPAEPGPYHQGGKLKIGPDNNLYAVIGDLNTITGVLQNYKNGTQPNDSSVIFRVNLDNGSAITDNNNNSFSNSNADEILHRYYAYGIRNSFGIDFDPVTGKLWDTENGEDSYDEINLVEPGFNSGWAQVMGPMSRNNNNSIEQDLIIFLGSNYADPVFSWKEQIGVTDIEFFNSTKLGPIYTNNIFIGDINNGNLYHFEVNNNRTGLKFAQDNNNGRGLDDLVADNMDELSAITFGTGFGRITDIETGPDGFLYVLSYEEGKIYRITS
jgi:glucose/arabinose dehydrogenase